MECVAGTYKDSSVTSCTKCAENSITDKTGAASCTSCSAGTVSNDERTQCGNVLFQAIFIFHHKQVKMTLPKKCFLGLIWEGGGVRRP